MLNYADPWYSRAVAVVVVVPEDEGDGGDDDEDWDCDDGPNFDSGHQVKDFLYLITRHLPVTCYHRS